MHHVLQLTPDELTALQDALRVFGARDGWAPGPLTTARLKLAHVTMQPLIVTDAQTGERRARPPRRRAA
uniref:Uncharacterized protein n=1 Tax=uncultured Caudovirales phage TaxID=2100421 RepID=A0A6J5LAR4_9CAUD|nr:hypothetical protein UFOVP114_103 [uncultured Caudovirales phage]